MIQVTMPGYVQFFDHGRRLKVAVEEVDELHALELRISLKHSDFLVLFDKYTMFISLFESSYQ